MAAGFTRRDFLGTAAGLTAAVRLGGNVRAAASARAGMFISLNSAVAPRVPWPDFARLAARIGYGGVDFPLASLRTAGAEPTRALLTELKLQPTITNLPLSIQAAEAAYQTAFAQLDDAAAFMADIGATHMMAVLPTTSVLPTDEFRAMYKQRLTAVAGVLAKHNIRLGLEFLGPLYFRTRAGQNPFIWTLPATVALAAECGPNIGAVLDVWHWHHSGGTAAEIVAAGKSRIVHVHMSDAKPMAAEDVRDNMRLFPGEGAIDYAAFFGALQRIGYVDGVAPEPLGRITPDMTAEDAAKQGFDTTQAVMRKAGVAV